MFESLEDRRLLAASPPLLSTIEGFNIDDNSFNSGALLLEPPDPYGAVGPEHVVNVGNVTVQWFTKDGTPQGHTSLKNFFSPLFTVTPLFDPKVVYDQYSERFVVLALEQMDIGNGDSTNASRILLAVSDDSDPNGTWYYHSINAQVNLPDPATPGAVLSYWTDYPGLAIDSEAIYVTGNLFEFSTGTGTIGGNRLWIVDKGDGAGGFYDNGPGSATMYDPAGDSGVDFTGVWTGFPGFRNMQPAHMFDDAPGGVGTWLAIYDGYTNGVDELVDLVRVDDPLGTPTFTRQQINVGDLEDAFLNPFLFATQRNPSTALIDGGDHRTLNAVWRNDSLYVTTVILPEQGPDINQVTAHWFRFDTSDLQNITLADQGDISGEDIGFNVHTMWPGVMVDAEDNMAITFSASGPTLYAGSYYATRAADDPPGTIRSSVAIAEGLDIYDFGGGINRWGDYSSVALDPTDEVTLWAYNMYALPEQGLGGRWGTRWGSFRMGEQAPPPPPGETTISGVVWNDANENRRRDDDEVGLEDWLVYVDLDNDGERDLGEPSYRTNSAGRYTFTLDGPGTYVVRESVKPGWRQTYPGDPDLSHTIVSVGDEAFLDVDFGNSDADGFDHGDAPAPYPTLEADNGARHAIIPGFGLGPIDAVGPELTDGEPDGLPQVDALGDDQDNEPDENGVEFTSNLAPDSSGTVDVTVSLGNNAPGVLNAWIDFNGNGNWSDPGEQVFTNLSLAEGTHTLTFEVPITAIPGSTYARFRYSQERDISFVGTAFSGEVEDHKIDILSDVPIAVNDQYTVDQDSTNNAQPVMTNDVPSSSGRANLRLASVNTAGSSGTAFIDRNGTPSDFTDDFIRYTPASGAFGLDTYSYTIEDVVGGGTDTAIVSVTIEQTPGVVPVAVDDSYTTSVETALDVLANDRVGPTGSIIIPPGGIDTTGTVGTVQLMGSPGSQYVMYTPAPTFAGTDQFRYTIIDANDVTDDATVTVHVPPHTFDDVIRFRLEARDENGNLLPDSDGDGIPEVGQDVEFQLHAYIKDMRGTPGYPPLDAGLTEDDQGVFSAYMDILYDAGMVAYNGTVAFPTGEYPAGHNFDASVPGIIDEAGAFQGLGSSPLGPDEELLFVVSYRASQKGIAEFKSDPADDLPLHETSLNIPPAAIDLQNIEFRTTKIEIVDSPDLVQLRMLVTTPAGDPIPGDQLVAGQEFLLHALVDDIREGFPDQGVFSAYLDVLYAANLASPVGSLTNPLGVDIEFGPLFNDGQKAGFGTPGLIDESGAFQGSSPVLFDDEQLLYTVRFVAQTPPTGVGTLIFDAQPANNLPLNETTLIKPDPGVQVPPAQISYVDSDPIQVVAAAGEGEFTNPNNRYDVNNDGYVSPFDMLLLVNYINSYGSVDLRPGGGGEGEASKMFYYDVNADMMITPSDLLSEVLYLNRLAAGGGQGEGEGHDGAAPLAASSVIVAEERLSLLPSSSGLPEVADQWSPGPADTQPGNEARATLNDPAESDIAWTPVEDGLPALDLVLSDELAEDVFAAWGDAELDPLDAELA